MLARIVAHGRRGAAQPRADPAARRHRVAAWFVPGGHRRGGRRVRRLDDLGPPPRLRLRAGRGRLGAHHRLPVRAWPRDADVDHGRRRQGRDRRRADQERRGAGALREGRHAGRRQDRHADRRQAARGRRASRGRASTRPTVLSLGRQPRAVERASARRRHRRRRARARHLPSRTRDRFRLGHRQGRHRHGRRPAGRGRQCQAARRSRHRRRRSANRAPTSCARDGATAMFVAVDGRAGRDHRGRRSDQGDDAGGARKRCARTACAS